MADLRLDELTAATGLDPTDLLYLLRDPSATRLDRAIEWSDVEAYLDTLYEPAGDLLPYLGAKVSRATAQTGVATATFTLVTWTVEDWDDGGWWASGTPTKLIVPSGVSKVDVKFNVSFQAHATGRRVIDIMKNSASVCRIAQQTVTTAGAPTHMSIGVDEAVAAGDYFEFGVYHEAGASLSIGADGIRASIKRLDD